MGEQLTMWAGTGVAGGEVWGVEGLSTRLLRLENGTPGDPVLPLGMNSLCTTCQFIFKAGLFQTKV